MQDVYGLIETFRSHSSVARHDAGFSRLSWECAMQWASKMQDYVLEDSGAALRVYVRVLDFVKRLADMEASRWSSERTCSLLLCAASGLRELAQLVSVPPACNACEEEQMVNIVESAIGFLRERAGLMGPRWMPEESFQALFELVAEACHWLRVPPDRDSPLVGQVYRIWAALCEMRPSGMGAGPGTVATRLAEDLELTLEPGLQLDAVMAFLYPPVRMCVLCAGRLWQANELYNVCLCFKFKLKRRYALC